jgi:hypothetical protein
MRWWTPLIPAILFLGCGPKEDDTDPVEDTDSTIPAIPTVFNASAPASEVGASISDDVVEAQQTFNALISAMSMIAADSEVQARLVIDNGDQSGSARAYMPQCWERPSPARSQFVINFDPCNLNYNVRGGVEVNDHPSGPVLFNFLNMAVNDREINGVFALDRIPSIPLAWQSYDTDTFSPGLDNRVPIGVDIEGNASGIRFDGGNSLNFGLGQEFGWWGVAQIQSLDATTEIYYGGTTPEAIQPTQPPGITSVKTSLSWMSCRCPVGGTVHYPELDLTINEFSFDLDDLKVEDDTFDDPVLIVESTSLIEGSATLYPTGCGTYTVDYSTTGTATTTVDADLLVAQISFQCEALFIEDAAHCDALIEAAREVGSVEIMVSDEQIQAAALAEINARFDTEYCTL